MRKLFNFRTIETIDSYFSWFNFIGEICMFVIFSILNQFRDDHIHIWNPINVQFLAKNITYLMIDEHRVGWTESKKEKHNECMNMYRTLRVFCILERCEHKIDVCATYKIVVHVRCTRAIDVNVANILKNIAKKLCLCVCVWVRCMSFVVNFSANI